MDHPLLNAFLMMLYFFLWVMWLFLLFRIISDLFRDHELSGWWKTLWLIGLLLLPFLGVMLYLIVRGRSMTERSMRSAQESEQRFQAYVRETAAGDPAAGAGSAEQLSKLAELKRNGDLTQEEFDQAKARVLA
jgi:ABC-type multidrug transport system fused ATPase/permease subunit